MFSVRYNCGKLDVYFQISLPFHACTLWLAQRVRGMDRIEAPKSSAWIFSKSDFSHQSATAQPSHPYEPPFG